MEAFDKKRCLDNIYFLAKQKSIKIGDLETAANVSAGYLSRANKEDNTSKLTIDLIAAIAQTLEVSIDRLVSYDLSGLSPNERRIIAFVEKLMGDTADGAVDWEKKEPAAVGSIQCYGDLIACTCAKIRSLTIIPTSFRDTSLGKAVSLSPMIWMRELVSS